MNVNHNEADSHMSGVPTHVYFLQNSSISLSPNEQGLPLHLLDNSLEYGPNQYLLPIQSKQRLIQDQMQDFIGPCQEPAKIMGFLVDKSYHNTPSQLAISNIKSEPVFVHNVVESDIVEQQSIKKARSDSKKLQLNTTVEATSVCEQGDSLPIIFNYVHIPDRVVPPRALAVLPSVLQIQRQQTITARRTLPIHARFGPVKGITNKISHSEAVEFVLNATSNKKPVFLKKNDEFITHIDTSDKDKSNWIGLLPLGDQNSANMWLYEENNDLYVVSTEIIPSRKPLLLGYSKKYADDYGLVGPIKDIEKDNKANKPLWCSECQRALPSAKLLERHRDLYHKDYKLVSRRRYRCRHCARTFSRLFTLRRHTSFHCPNTIDKKPSAASNETEPQINLNRSLCSDDNKIPSDESFQNYSNGLDFSTNLFDTDRIPSLDISGNSRSENDFSPYGIGYKDDNGGPNDLDFSIKKEKDDNSHKEKPEAPIEQLLMSCPDCKEIVVKGKRRRHLSECPARRFECECKKVFTDKNKLAQHIFTQHSNEGSSKNDNDVAAPANTNPQDSTLYKCEQCQHTFKRRGMLVNHLWRVHNTISSIVPLERRVRHYPCVICPKIYRTAAKRDRHVLLHHPGAGRARAAVEGGTRWCEPAACAACPRQYATRAKLLQHHRAAHPHLAPPTNPKSSGAANSG